MVFSKIDLTKPAIVALNICSSAINSQAFTNLKPVPNIT
jgi:hypothetical protein